MFTYSFCRSLTKILKFLKFWRQMQSGLTQKQKNKMADTTQHCTPCWPGRDCTLLAGLDLTLAVSGRGWIFPGAACLPRPGWAGINDESCLTNPQLGAQLLNLGKGKRTKFVDFNRNLYFYQDGHLEISNFCALTK